MGSRAALGVGDPSAGLGDEQRSGKQVRAGAGELPEGVDPAGGHVQQVQGRGHGGADDERVEEHRGDRGADAPHDLFVLVRPGLAGGHDAQAEVRGPGDVQWPAVEVGARAGERGVGLAGQRQVDRGEHRLVLTHEGGGHRPLRQGVQVVDVAFGRIHDPPFAGRQRPAVQFVLHPAGVRAQAREAGAQDIEGRVVVGGERAHQLFAGLVADHLAEALAQRRTRLTRGDRGLGEQVGVGGGDVSGLKRFGHGGIPV